MTKQSASTVWLEPLAFATVGILAQIPVTRQTDDEIARTLTQKGVPLPATSVAILLGQLRDKGFIERRAEWYEITEAGRAAQRDSRAFYRSLVAIAEG